MTGKSNFGQWLRQRRKALGLTQAELAQRAGCAQVTLRKIEAGDLAPSAPLAASLAKAVGAVDADLPGLVSLARGAGDDFTTKARLLRPQRPNNLTAQLTPLIGRERDIAAMRRRLLSDGARLITLLGPPGVGKTRLAQAVAEEVLEHFEHGVFFVRLAPIGDPDQVASAIAQALGLQMSGPNAPALQLRAYLEEQHLLLVLDNFEQILAAAPLVDDLLRHCPWLHVLVTSREPLRVRGERQMTVHPLALPTETRGASNPTAEDVLRYSAVALFAERAEAVQPDFVVSDGNAAAVAELCRRLDGLPLAIELVAARVKLLPPAELVARLRGPWLLSMDGLRDVSARQKTLRNAIGWSYDLLTPAEQTLFTRLAVFVGGCTLEAAEMMCGDGTTSRQVDKETRSRKDLGNEQTPPSSSQVLNGIASLLDKSLLHRAAGMYGEPRYVMLETVREYGLERVVASGQEVLLRERHVDCFLQLIETAEHARPNPDLEIIHLIDDEIHNVRAALAWIMNQNVQTALRLTASLLSWYGLRDPYAEGRRLMDAVFAMPGASARTIPRAKALIEAGYLMNRCNENVLAQTYEKEAIAICQEMEYKNGIADALLKLGMYDVRLWAGQGKAYEYFEQSTAIYKELNDPARISFSLVQLAWVVFLRADYPQARTLAEEALTIAQQAGLRDSFPFGVLGAIAYAEGDANRARALQEQRLAIERQRREVNPHTLLELVTTATRQGDFLSAHAFLDELLVHVSHRNKNDSGLCECYMVFGKLVQAEGDLKHAVQLYRACLAGVEFNKGIWGQYLLYLAGSAAEIDRHELTVKLLGTAETVDATIQPLFPIERGDCNRLAEAARAHLGAKRFDAAWAQGREQEFMQVAEETVLILETALRVEVHATPTS